MSADRLLAATGGGAPTSDSWAISTDALLCSGAAFGAGDCGAASPTLPALPKDFFCSEKKYWADVRQCSSGAIQLVSSSSSKSGASAQISNSWRAKQVILTCSG